MVNAETVLEEFDVFFSTFIHENTYYKIDIQIEGGLSVPH